MNKKLGVFLVLIVLAGGGYYFYHTQLSSSFLSKTQVRFNWKERPVRSAAGLEERGLQLRRVPNIENAAIAYSKASNLFRKTTPNVESLVNYVTDNAWVTDREIVLWFDNNEPCRRLLHRAVRKPDCQFPHFGKDNDCIAAVELPHLPTMQSFTRLLICEGKRHEHDEDYSKAVDCYLAASKVAEHIEKSESLAFGKSVAAACYGIVNKAVERCVASGKLSEDELRRVVDRYEEILAAFPQLGDALEMERASGDDLVKEMAAHPADIPRVFPNIPAEQAQAIAQLMKREGDEIWKNRKRLFTGLKKWCALPTWEALRPGNDWDAQARKYASTNVIVMPSLGPIRRVLAMGEAEAGGVAIFAAIKLYEKKNGRPPASLTELKGDCISKLPKDPFSGRDYVYKVQGTEWVLYSVSGNLADDGGAGRMPHNYADDRDLVFWSKPIPLAPQPQNEARVRE